MTHKLEAGKYDSIMRDLDGISARTMTEHLQLYQGYINKYNEIVAKLERRGPRAGQPGLQRSAVAQVDLTFAIGGVKNHELYFGHWAARGASHPAISGSNLRRISAPWKPGGRT